MAIDMQYIAKKISINYRMLFYIYERVSRYNFFNTLRPLTMVTPNNGNFLIPVML